MSGKREKMAFRDLGEPKNAENAHRRLTKRKKREKGPVVGRRNAENAEKQFFVPLRRAKNAENRVS